MENIKDFFKTNTAELRKKFKEKGLNMEKIRKEIDLGRTSMSYRMNNKQEFSQSQIKYLKKRLGLSNDEVVKIFFS